MQNPRPYPPSIDANETLEKRLKTFWNFEDFATGLGAGLKAGIWYATGGGTAALCTDIAGTATRPGIVQGTTGSTATGSAGIFAHVYSASQFLFGAGVYTFETDICIPTLSTVTETFAFYSGFGDSLAAESVDGVYFKYSDAGATPNWYAVTANNSTRTTTDTSTAVAANTWTRLRVVVNSTGTSVAYHINGTLVATNTTNIPTAAGRETSALTNIIKSAGLTARTWEVDWTWVHIDLTTSR